MILRAKGGSRSGYHIIKPDLIKTWAMHVESSTVYVAERTRFQTTIVVADALLQGSRRIPLRHHRRASSTFAGLYCFRQPSALQRLISMASAVVPPPLHLLHK
jgi:hypothetical protein